MTRIAVIGASGFVGSAVVDAARSAGHDTLSLSGPRLATAGTTHEDVITALAAQLGDVDVVVNCAGNPDASATRIEDLEAANSVLPGVIGAAARRAAVPRYVHVSSAVVQGRLPVLDSSDRVDGFSPYARSKIGGENRARAQGPSSITVYRPPSVHSPTRRVTRQLTAIARSPLSTVAAPGDRPSPQTHVLDVADAILFLCTSPVSPPSVVHHPWQGHTTAGLLHLLGGGRRPREIPARVARVALRAASGASRLSPRAAPYARRIEMIWLGQAQGSSWLTEQGWRPLTTEDDWMLLAQQARSTTLNSNAKDER